MSNLHDDHCLWDGLMGEHDCACDDYVAIGKAIHIVPGDDLTDLPASAPEPGPAVEETLPPTQYLMMEVLAARHRLGENYWTFPAKHSRIASELELKGLVQWKSGITECTIRVWLTDAGKESCLSATYTAQGQLT